MASLTHVCMWTEHGWKRVTADEVSHLHPGGTVSARSGIFMCELCGQYVTLTNGSIRDRYFKHSQYEKNKDCPERTFAPWAPITFSENDHGLPIRIHVVSPDRFELEMGLLPVPKTALGKRRKGTLSIISSNGEKFIFSYDRLNKETITYVSIGNVPAASYMLNPSGDREIIDIFWPPKVVGIDGSGAIFDFKSGKKLAYDADVEVGKNYYLLKRGILWNDYESISIIEKCSCRYGWETWSVYQVCANKFDGEAACFFLDFHCRLTEEPVEIFPLWPSCVEAPYVTFHKEDVVNMFFRGDANPKTFPYSYISKKGDKSGSILNVRCTERQQLLSAGRSKILEYTYLWKDPLEYQGEIPNVSVMTLSGTPFDFVESNSIPEKGLLEIKAPYDGEIIVEEEGKIEIHYRLQANRVFLLDSIHTGQLIKIYQGLNLVWFCHFIKGKDQKTYLATDKQMLEQLMHCRGEEIAIPHSTGAMVSFMEHYPECKKWLQKEIKRGKVNDKALKILESNFRRAKS